MHLILTGATGLVGSACLQHMLGVQEITRLSILSRRPVPMASGHSHVNVIIQKDFSTYSPEILAQLKGAEGCVWAQGTSVNNVSKDAYTNITYDYPLAAAKAFSTNLEKPFKFVYVSGEGTSTTPSMFTPFFGVIKGRAEAALLQLSKDDPNLRPYSLRPAGVDPTFHPEIHEYIPTQDTIIKRLGKALISVSRSAWKDMVSPTRDLGRVLTDLAMGDGMPLEGLGIEAEGRTISNKGFRRLAGI